MVRASFLPILLLLSFSATAQHNVQLEVIRKGLLRAQSTIAPALLVNGGNLNIYIHGDMDYFLSRKVSIRGDGYYFIDTQGNGDLKHNHSIFFGANYHFLVGRFDPYIGFQPGASYVQVSKKMPWEEEGSEITVNSRGMVVPSISAAAGINFYVGRFVHFMASVRYVHGNHAVPWGNLPLDELRFSFGLGWNVNTMKQK